MECKPFSKLTVINLDHTGISKKLSAKLVDYQGKEVNVMNVTDKINFKPYKIVYTYEYFRNNTIIETKHQSTLVRFFDQG